MRDAAFITGASSGIGLAIAKTMLANGMVVFAGVRKDTDAAALAALGATPVKVDITDAEQLSAAVESVRDQLGEHTRLVVLVNNAGVVVTAPLEFVDLGRLRWQLEVNVVAQVAVTQSFLPLIRKSSGRVVFIGSTAGYLSAPFVGAYSASKFAIEAIADSL
ncbi:MAG: NAD(P)-dependent dehydrogenase (short-subunit alcohol dehydrogenase family), partial [Bradymonadia bacterium]